MISGNITLKAENSEYGIETNADSVAMDANNLQKGSFSAKPYIVSSGVKSYLSGLSSDISFYFAWQAFDKSDNEVSLQNSNKKYGTSGADVVSDSPYNISIEDSEASGKVSYLKLTLSVNSTVVYTKRIYLNRDLPVVFARSEVWSSGLAFNNGQVIISNGVVYQWSYPHSGNSAVDPTDDIANNPTTTHWIAYQQWTLLATKIIMAAFALLGGAVFSGDYMYSQQGKDANGNATSNYNLFDASKLGTANCPFTPNLYFNYKTGDTYQANGTFSGNLKGVSGSFKSLMCVDNDGNEVGEITFDSGKVTFNSCDIQHQGQKDSRTLRFLTSNLWCRGSFGTNVKNYAVVSGNVIYYYVNGNNTDYVRAVMASQSYNGKTYYRIPLNVDPTFNDLTSMTAYGNCKVGDIYGFPVDMIIFNSSSGTWYYNIIGEIGKELVISNVDDTMNGIRYASCQHVDQQLSGGEIHTLINLSSFMYPARTNGSISKSGWMIKGTYDNNYN